MIFSPSRVRSVSRAGSGAGSPSGASPTRASTTSSSPTRAATSVSPSADTWETTSRTGRFAASTTMTPRGRRSMSRSFRTCPSNTGRKRTSERATRPSAVPAASESPARAREAEVMAAPSTPGSAHLAVRRAVREAEDDEVGVGRQLVEVLLVLVGAEREGRAVRGPAAHPGQRDRSEPLPLRPPEEGHRLREDEDEDEEDAQDDEDAAEGDHPGGATVDELDARDPLGRGRHPLADADAGCGHGVRAPRGNACTRGGTPPAPPRARKRSYSSFFSSSAMIAAGRGR